MGGLRAERFGGGGGGAAGGPRPTAPAAQTNRAGPRHLRRDPALPTHLNETKGPSPCLTPLFEVLTT
jgi:hypothetical protein